MHQLLSHTTGIRDGVSFYGPHDDEALARFVRSWTDDYLIVEPGEIFSYSNLGYVLAARVLEAVSDKPFANVMTCVFQPLGMCRTTRRPIMAITYPLAQGHDVLPGQMNPTVVRPFADDSRKWANGGVFPIAADFARFAKKATELAVPLKPTTTSPQREPIAMTVGEMQRSVGTYQNAPDYLRLELIVKDSKLFLKQAGQVQMSQVVKVGNNTFNAGGQEFLLIPGANGKIKFMHIAVHALGKV